MKKIIAILLILTTFICIFTINSFGYWLGDTPDVAINDVDDLLSSADESMISTALIEAGNGSGVAYRVYIYEGYEYYDVYDFRTDTGYIHDDLVLLVINKKGGEYYYYLDTYGEPHTLISDKEVKRILDTPAVFDNIKSGNLTEGIQAFIPQAKLAVEGVLRPAFGRVLVVSLVIAFIAAAGSALGVVLFYRRKLHSESYPLSKYASLKLNLSHDTFLRKSVTRVRVNSSSSSGGRSGGGGGGRRGGR